MTDAVQSRSVVRQNTPAKPSATRARLVRVAHAIAATRLPSDPFERLFYSGLVLTSAGLYFIAAPLALLVPGVALSTVAFILKLRGR